MMNSKNHDEILLIRFFFHENLSTAAIIIRTEFFSVEKYI